MCPIIYKTDIFWNVLKKHFKYIHWWTNVKLINDISNKAETALHEIYSFESKVASAFWAFDQVVTRLVRQESYMELN